jgi:outer membrane biosynthesis protein TonB
VPPPPPPKPEPKPEPKPAPPAPPPPPPKPTPPKPKQDQASFNNLLKNLEQNDPAQNQPDQPKRQSSSSRRASSQPVAPLGPQLTASELDLVKQQIYECWNVPVGARGATDLTPEFRVTMNPDATVRGVVLLNSERSSEPFFRAAAESARRALLNPQCSPLKLPLDKFNQWQTFTITFDPKDIAG